MSATKRRYRRDAYWTYLAFPWAARAASTSLRRRSSTRCCWSARTIQSGGSGYGVVPHAFWPVPLR